MNLTGFTNIFARTAAQIEKTVQSTVNEVTGPKALLDYEIGEQIASGGPGLLWKIYKAKSKKTSAHSLSNDVSIWILDKKSLAEERTRRGTSKVAEEALLDIFRSDAKLLLRLRHPGIVKVIEAMEENKSSMVIVTEPIFRSVSNAYGRFTSEDANLNSNSSSNKTAEFKSKDVELSKLEIKHGLIQIAETLHFLHKNARLIHRSISPESIFLTMEGSWKLACFGFSTTVDLVSKEEKENEQKNENSYANTNNESSMDAAFHYPEYDVDSPSLPLQPPLDFCAPEWTQKRREVKGMMMSSMMTPNLWGESDSSIGKGTSLDPATHAWTSPDVFSLGLLVYFLLTKKSLIKSKNNLNTYMATIRGFLRDPLIGIDYEFENELRRMVSLEASSRPSAEEFSNSSFFCNDIGVKALRFLDHILEKDSLQKTDFFKALTELWKDFDSRVLRYKVLPPLLTEIKNESLQVLTLPLVLNIVDKQDSSDFCSLTLPVLLPIFQNASGEVMLFFVKNVCMLACKVPSDVLNSSFFPLVVKAYDNNDVKIQEEILKGTPKLLSISSFDITLFVQNILPRVHALALKTSVAAVRVHALLCLGELASKVEKKNVLDIVQTLSRCSFVDHSVPTLMTVLSVADIIQKQFDEEFSAQYILPLLCPLLVVQQLSPVHFSKFITLFYTILKKIEKHRGINVNLNGNGVENETNLDSNSWTNWSSTQQQNGGTQQNANNSIKPSSSSWDASDWTPISNKSNSSPNLTSNENSVFDNAFMSSTSSSLSSPPNPVSTASPPPVNLSNEFEWIPTPMEKEPTLSPLSLASPLFSTSSYSSVPYSISPNPPLTKTEESLFPSLPPASANSTESITAHDYPDSSFSFPEKEKHPATFMNNPPSLQKEKEMEDDPFSDWPPKPQNAYKGVGEMNLSASSISSPSYSLPSFPPPSTNFFSTAQNSSSQIPSTDFGDFFSSPVSSAGNSIQTSNFGQSNTMTVPMGLKLAPPPSGSSVNKLSFPLGAPPAGHGVGRGRGRGLSAQAGSNTGSHSNSNLGSLLDL